MCINTSYGLRRNYLWCLWLYKVFRRMAPYNIVCVCCCFCFCPPHHITSNHNLLPKKGSLPQDGGRTGGGTQKRMECIRTYEQCINISWPVSVYWICVHMCVRHMCAVYVCSLIRFIVNMFGHTLNGQIPQTLNTEQQLPSSKCCSTTEATANGLWRHCPFQETP